MKVTPEHQAALRAEIEPLDTPERRTKYRAGDFPRSDAVQDLDKRYRWDLLWACTASGPVAYDTPVGKILSEGRYKDAHLDTALRSIVAPLTPKESA